VAVASAGPYASLHLAPDRQPRQYPTTPFFLQAGCPSCRPTNSIKALKVCEKCGIEQNMQQIAYSHKTVVPNCMAGRCHYLVLSFYSPLVCASRERPHCHSAGRLGWDTSATVAETTRICSTNLHTGNTRTALLISISLYLCPQIRPPFYFLNNSAKN